LWWGIITEEDDEKSQYDQIVDLAIEVGVWMGGLTALHFFIATSHIAMFSMIGERLARRVRRLAFENVLRQDIAYFDKHMGGELNTRLAE
jgi:ABC-type multidrug transport system fused ATPase/permease subunit